MTDSMEPFGGQRAIFDTVATGYDSARPGYPEAVIDAVIRYSGISAGGRILEIGCGTGQATLPFASRGYQIVCLEPGRNLAAARQKLAVHADVLVVAVTLEDWPLAESAFDLAMSAQAFHWIALEVGLPKAALALKPSGDAIERDGGHLAVHYETVLLVARHVRQRARTP